MATLFTGQALSTLLEQSATRAVDWVNKLQTQSITGDAPGVAGEAIDRFGLPDIALDLDAVTSTAPRENTDSAGTYWYITLHVPYTGGSLALFQLKPSSFHSGEKPDGTALPEEVQLIVKAYEKTPEALNERAHAALSTLERYVEWINADLQTWRPTFEHRLRAAVDRRSKSIKERRDAASKLDFPIRP